MNKLRNRDFLDVFFSLFLKSLGFILVIFIHGFISKRFGSEFFGEFALILRIIEISCVVGLFGITNSIIFYLSGKDINYDVGQYIGGSLSLHFIIGTIITILIICINAIYPFLTTEKFPILFISIGFLICNNILLSYFISDKKLVSANFFDKPLRYLIILFGFLIFGLDLEIKVVYIFTASFVLLFFLSLFKANKRINFKFSDLYDGMNFISQSKDLFFANLATVLRVNAVLIILKLFVSFSDVGIFAACLEISLITNFIMKILNSYLSPRIAIMFRSNENFRLKKLLRNVYVILFFLGISLVLVNYICGGFILNLWGIDSQLYFNLFMILSLSAFLNLVSGPSGNIIVMSGNFILNRNLNLFNTIFLIILLFVFSHFYGLYGAGAAMLISSSLINSLRFYYANKFVKIL